MIVQLDKGRCVSLAVGLDFVDGQRAQRLVVQGVGASGTAADGVALRPCTDVHLTVRWSAKRK